MTRMQVRDVALNVITAGAAQPTTPSLLLLHGFTGSAETWDDLMRSLAGNAADDEQGDGVHCVAVDLLGHGHSDAPPESHRYTMHQATDDLTALLDHLGLPRVHLLGYSLGGRVALRMAATRPERVASLILESASPGLPSPGERQARMHADEMLARSIERDGVAAFVERWEAIPLFASQARLPQEQRAALRAQRLHNSVLGLANSLRGMGTGVQESLWDQLPRLQVRALLMAGHDDAKFAEIARQMETRLPDARTVIVADAGHAVHLEQPAVFKRLVREHLAVAAT